jgi:hypothetical protein
MTTGRINQVAAMPRDTVDASRGRLRRAFSQVTKPRPASVLYCVHDDQETTRRTDDGQLKPTESIRNLPIAIRAPVTGSNCSRLSNA